MITTDAQIEPTHPEGFLRCYCQMKQDFKMDYINKAICQYFFLIIMQYYGNRLAWLSSIHRNILAIHRNILASLSVASFVL